MTRLLSYGFLSGNMQGLVTRCAKQERLHRLFYQLQAFLTANLYEVLTWIEGNLVSERSKKMSTQLKTCRLWMLLNVHSHSL